ncbi:hypothetical protein M569_02877, partial [Genlisea aurea]
RMEKVDIKKLVHQAKVVGTIISVGGAMLMTLYKGPLVHTDWSSTRRRIPAATTAVTGDREWLIGCIFLIVAALAWASLFILQKAALRTYAEHQLSLTAFVCSMGTLQAAVVAFVAERKNSAWRIGWDMNLLAAAYAV